jgi:hypothetical protein
MHQGLESRSGCISMRGSTKTMAKYLYSILISEYESFRNFLYAGWWTWFDWGWLWRVFVGLYRWTPSRPKPWPRFTDKPDHCTRTRESHFLVLLVLLFENSCYFVQKGRNAQRHVKYSHFGGSRRIAGRMANTSNNLPSCCIFNSASVATRLKIL